MARLLFLQDMEYEFLGPMYISSMAKTHGHEVRLAIGNTLDEFNAELSSFKPDVVGFSVMSGSHKWALGIAESVKKEFGVRNIFGGAHPTFFPEFIDESPVDMILRGEGEDSVLELLDKIDSKQSLSEIPNIWYKNGSISKNDLRSLRPSVDDYPFPDRVLYNSLEKRIDRSIRNVITSRGCPWHCSFCFEDAMREMYDGKGKYVRIRAIDSVIEECLELKSRT